MPVHVFTSVTCNYLPKARVLAESVRRFHPDFVFHVVLVDPIPPWFKIEREPFDSVITIQDLGLRNADQWLFKHSVVEACTGVKGKALTRLLSKRDCSAVIYFDPDIVVLSSLTALVEEFANADVLLTPHLTEPEQTLEAIYDNEFSVLQHGIYNLGFLGVKSSAPGRRFAQWWAERLNEFCYDDIPKGIFTDQRWADLAPAYFDGVHVIRGPEYNVCTWNLTHREVKGNTRSGFKVNGHPMVFYHFSGLDSGAQEAMLQKYGSRMPALRELRDWYLAECERNGQSTLGTLPWSYAEFDNGATVTADHRKRYRDRGDLQVAFPHPFATADVGLSYHHWFEANDPSRNFPTSKLSPLQSTATGFSPVPPFPSQPSYRIFLSICGVEPEIALRSALEIKFKSFRSDDLYVLGTEQELAHFFTSQDIRDSFHSIVIADALNHNVAFSTVANKLGREMDFAFVTPAVSVCNLWDIRLAWTASAVPGVATASPLSDSEAFTRLGMRSASRVGVDQIDAALYEISYFANPEIPSFARHCVYVNRRALVETGPVYSAEDFAAKASRRRWTHVLADHIYTGLTNPAPAFSGKTPLLPAIEFLRDNLNLGAVQNSNPGLNAARRQLHVMHSWGGGLERWVGEYCRSDSEHRNFVLKSVGTWGAFGMELRLYDSIDSHDPIQQWALTPSIKHTAGAHTAYRAAISEIVYRYGIDAILVSSLVGHSLEVFRTGHPTLMICHDYYPFCPALNVTFGETVCRKCGQAELESCTLENEHHRFFRNVPSTEWTELRTEFSQALAVNAVQMIAPSASVQDLYARFMPEIRSRFQVIPHGTSPFREHGLILEFPPARRLRVLIPGILAPHKGLALLDKIAVGLLAFADLYLVGCGDSGEQFRQSGVTVIPSYEWSQLPELLQSIAPDIALLLSIVPETFSYTLQEMFELGIPPVATRLGSFVDRIQHGINGFLVDPVPSAVLDRLRELAQNRTPLKQVSQFLREHPPRRTEQMLADYDAVIGLPTLSKRAYFSVNRLRVNDHFAGNYVQLIWKTTSSGFQEESSVRVHPRDAGPATICLRIPEQHSNLIALRLDLGDKPGFLLLHRLRLVNSAGDTVWSWQSREGPLVEKGHDLICLGGGISALVCLLGPDPHLILPIALEQLNGLRSGGTLEIEMAYPSMDEAMNDIIGRLSNDAENIDRRKVLNSHLFANTVKSRRDSGSELLLHQLTAARDRAHEIERSLSWRMTAPLRWGGGLILSKLSSAKSSPARK